MEIFLQHRSVDAVVILDVAGEIDIYTSPKLKSALEDLLDEGHSRLLINLLQTKYLDSTALSVFSSPLKRARGVGGNLALIYNQPQIAKIFTITGLHEVFPVYNSETEALNAAKGWGASSPKG